MSQVFVPKLERGVVMQCSNLYRHLSFIPSRLPGGHIRSNGEAMLVNSGYASDTFNKATHFILPADGSPLYDPDYIPLPGMENSLPVIGHFSLDEYLDDVEAFFGDLPFTWWLGPDTEPTNLGEKLEKRGLVVLETSIGMSLNLEQFKPTAPVPAELDMQWVKTPEQLADYANLMAANWTPPDSVVPKVYQEAAADILAPGAFIHFAVGYVNDKPVCGVEFWRGPARLVGVYGLVALQEHRKKGYASALLQSGLLHWQQEGMNEATLQASPDGLGVYERLGFKPYGKWLEYGKKEQA